MILTITLNVALDHIIILSKLEENAINRVKETYTIPGGKGINIASGLAVLGEEVITTGFVGGKKSLYLEHKLQDLGITTNFVYIDEEIRTNILILEKKNNINSLIIEKGDFIKERYQENFLENYKRVINNVHTIIIGGSLPPGIEAAYVNKLIDIARNSGKNIILNFREEIVRKLHPYQNNKSLMILKPDIRDAEKFDGLDYNNQNNRLKLGNKYIKKGIDLFILNYSEFKYFLATKGQAYEVTARGPLTESVSLLGIEDSFLAGFLYKYWKKRDFFEALSFALAAAIAASKSINNYPKSYREIQKYLDFPQIKEVKC
jgi:1-phosphofructokinase family hexose kinase